MRLDSFRVANHHAGNAKLGRFDLENPFHRPLESELKCQDAIFIQAECRHGLDVKIVSDVGRVEHHVANVDRWTRPCR